MLKTQAQRAFSLLRSRIIWPLSPTPTLKTQFVQFSNTPSLCRNPNDEDQNRDPESPPKLLVVQPRIRHKPLMQAKLNEALNLANSLEEQRDGYFATDLSEKQLPSHVVVQNPLAASKKGRAVLLKLFCDDYYADTYFGPGTRAWGKPVLDRVGLIIDIFNAHAYTKEAKLQAELAALMYKKSRLVRVRGSDGRSTFGATGEAEVVSARGRGSGGRGFIGGAGETELELQRRRISERRKRLLAEIAEVRRTRAVQRAARRKQGASDSLGLATVAVVGYTNAGKSTLVSTLTDSDLYSDDRRKILLSDTVGFISDLPVQLVEAFHATLEEVVEADLLVHVLDSSAPNLDEQRQAVLDVLRQIGVSEKKIQDMIEIDLQGYTEGKNFEDHCDGNFDEEGEMGDELELQEHEMENQHGDYSDGWLGPGTDQESDEEQVYASMGWTGLGDQNMLSNEKKGADNDSQREHVPHVKTSAITGVGLQELLELIDYKLMKIENEGKQSQRGVLLILAYLYSGSGRKEIVVSRIEGEFSGTLELQKAIPLLKKAYGDDMRKVLHVGPESCSVVSKLLKEEDVEAWGIEPYDLEDPDATCKNLVRKGIVRVADIKFPLPYRSESFSLVIVSDALDYLSPKYLNKTIPELARVSADGIVIFTGYPGQQRARVTELSKFGRPAKMRSQSWWVKFFVQVGMDLNETAGKKFEEAATKNSYKPSCQVFHLKSAH
ncbi:hypothetical protein Cgig2_009563 [Carnegiea gigantea]|uniref:Hflx-type G domain-containing protein n=1 Tax=Carnegiea gigantea TaxID=171969 RepID=A0A9Q1QFC1_9CARY|nr:hypothetical protein Cgig2_009563 [Carnegiea gigantea]